MRSRPPSCHFDRSRTLRLCHGARIESASDAELVYRWDSYAEDDAVRSVPRYVEAHADRLRAKYLAFIHDLGEATIDGRRVIDHLARKDGLSYWWMTLLVEKSLYKSSITDVIRALALEEIVVAHNVTALRLVSPDRRLAEVSRRLCRNLGIPFTWERQRSPMGPRDIRQFAHALPHTVQALVTLFRQVFSRRSFILNSKSAGRAWWGGEDSVFFCGPFTNFNRQACLEGRFDSDLWKGLPELLQRRKLRGNWLHLFVQHDLVPDSETAQDMVRRLDERDSTNGHHAFIDAFVSRRIVFAVLREWLRLNLRRWRLRNIENLFQPADSRLSLWPLMRRDWHASLCGRVAIDNALWIELFDAAMASLPLQRQGFYLAENQAWERALVHAWRRHGHGQLVAVAHSTVRYWDLRHYSDPRTCTSSAPARMPRADFVALNGKAAVEAYLEMAFPREMILECEALRYGYLARPVAKRSAGPVEGSPLKVLVLGDYLQSATLKLMELLVNAAPHVSRSSTYTIKPHPRFVVKAEAYRALNLKVVTDPLPKILSQYDIAYAGNMTSAAVDAYLSGLRVIVMLDESELNFSPLRGRRDVRFVGTARELADALQKDHAEAAAVLDRNDFFFLDEELSRWQQLLTR